VQLQYNIFQKEKLYWSLCPSVEPLVCKLYGNGQSPHVESLAIAVTTKYKRTVSNVGQVRSYWNFDKKLTDKSHPHNYNSFPI